MEHVAKQQEELLEKYKKTNLTPENGGRRKPRSSQNKDKLNKTAAAKLNTKTKVKVKMKDPNAKKK